MCDIIAYAVIGLTMGTAIMAVAVIFAAVEAALERLFSRPRVLIS